MFDISLFWRTVYALPNFVAALGMFAVAWLAWRYRTRRGALALCLFAVGAFFWTFFEALNFVGFSNEWILFFWCMEALGVSVAPLAMVVAVIDYFGYGHFLTRRRIAFLSIVPLLELLASITNPWHGWVWRAVQTDHGWPIPILTNVPGPVSWVSFAYGTLLLFAAICFLLLHLHQMHRPQRHQVYMVIIAMLLPLLATGMYVARVSPLPNTSLTTLAFLVSGFVLMCGFWRTRLFELPPVTAYEIYRSQEDAVFVLNETNRVLDLNDAACRMLSHALVESVGHYLHDLMPQALDMPIPASADGRFEVPLGGHYYDVHLTTLHSVDRRFTGRLMVWRDVTERKRLESELRRLATIDELTGVHNRRHFFARGAEDIEHARRYGRPLSLIMVDVDYFKEVNDRHGHEAGDRALVALARLLSCELRTVDCIGRIGGEEFALLLPETDVEAAHQVGRRLIEKVGAARVELTETIALHLTVSVGIATLKPEESSMSALMRRADRALYQAKHQGRNRLVQF